MKRTWLSRVAGLAAVWCVAGAALGQVGRSTKPAPRLEPEVIKEFGGTKSPTRPSRDAVMGFSLPTQVRDVLVRGGAEVKKGQMLVKGDDAEDLAVLELQKPTAESDWPVQRAAKTTALAHNEYVKTKKIREGGGSNDQELERAKLSAEAAELDEKTAAVKQQQEVLQVKRLQARVDKFHLLAPFDGQIDNVLVDVGQSVNENEKVVRVVNVDPLWMDVPAPTEDPATLALKEGDKAWVLIDVASGPRIAEGTVIEVSPTTDFASRSRRVRVELANPKGPERVLAGEAAWVRFTEPSKSVMDKVVAAAEVLRDGVRAAK